MADKAVAVRSNSISAYILFAVVAFAPLPFGSTDPAAVAFWCIVLGVGLIFSNPRALNRRHLLLLGLAALLIAAYGIVLHEQLSPHPWFAIATPHPVWAEASSVLHKPLQPSVSIARNQPFFSLGAPLAAMLSLLVSLVVCCDRSRAKQLLHVIAWSGVAYAVYGIFAHLFDPTHILWREKQAYLSVLTSTFINRNTAAVYFGSCSVIWSILLYERILHHVPPGRIQWRQLPNRLMSKTRQRPSHCLFHVVCLSRRHVHDRITGRCHTLAACNHAWLCSFFSPRSADAQRPDCGFGCRRRLLR